MGLARKYTNLRVNRVDVVDKGANSDKRTGDGAHILLYKRDGQESAGNETVGKVALKCPECAESLPTSWGMDGQQIANYCPNCGAKIDLKAKASKLAKLLPDALAKALGLMDDEQPAGAPVAKQETTIMAATASETQTIDIAKAVEEAVAKAMKPLQEENAQLKAAVAEQTTIAKAAQADKDVADMTVVLKSFTHVPVDATKDVSVFVALKKADGAGYARVLELLSAADAQLKLGKTLATTKGAAVTTASGEQAAAGAGTEDAYDTIMKAAEGLVAAKEAKTVEQATEIVLKRNPDLRKRWDAERNPRSK